MKTLLLLSLCSFSIWAQHPHFAKAELQSATVYFSGAELRQKATLALPEGTSEIVLSNVANQLDESSLRISAPKSVTVLASQFTQNYASEYDPQFDHPELQPVHDSLRKFNNLLQKAVIQRNAADKTLGLLLANTLLQNPSSGLITQQLTSFSTYFQTKIVALKWEALLWEEQQNQLEQKIAVWQSRLTPKSSDPSLSKGQLVLYVSHTQSGPVTLNISYITPLAGWEPTYDLKAHSLTEPLDLVMKSMLWQTTGIPWKKVKLTLSNGNPATQHEAPLQQAWTLVYRNLYGRKEKVAILNNAPVLNSLQGQLAGVNITGATGNPGSESKIIIRGYSSGKANVEPLYIINGKPSSAENFRSLPPNAIKSVEVLKDASAVAEFGTRGSNGVIIITTKQDVSDYTEVVERELNVSFEIDLPYDIVSNGKKHGIEIKNLEIPASYQYYCVPKINTDVFLMASITDFGKYNLLPGKAQLYFEDTVVGSTQLNPNETQDTLRLSLGRDKKITVLREKVNQQSGIRFLSTQKEQHFTYEITVRNNKKEAVEIDLRDQYPLSNDASIRIELTEKSKSKIDEEKGFLRWTITLQSNASKKVRFSYQIRSDKNKSLGKL
ncbi:MAG: hypothetical protein RLZZ500_917 [Bacteroidota bacterium]|jgi:TonB-dependent SusC/RagA subfamily outer membrane receptor